MKYSASYNLMCEVWNDREYILYWGKLFLNNNKYILHMFTFIEKHP